MPHFHCLTLNFLLIFTLYRSFNCLFLRFKINKLLIFVVGLAIFFPHILDQIGLMLSFFFLFKKAKINFSIELIYSLTLFQRFQNFILRCSKQKYFQILYVKKKKKITSQGVRLNPLNTIWHHHCTKCHNCTAPSLYINIFIYF